MENEVAKIEQQSGSPVSIYTDPEAFKDAQRICKMLVSSSIVPKDYQGEDKMANALVAYEMAVRMGASPIMVMQNLHVIQGRPGWASTFIIAMINSCGRFTPLKFRTTKEPAERIINYAEVEWQNNTKRTVQKQITILNMTCVAHAKDKNGDDVESPPVSIETAVREGWFGKDGSKWPTMPELMLSYRAAAFFGRLHCPDILQGMYTADEIEDIRTINIEPIPQRQAAASPIADMNATVVDAEIIPGDVDDELGDEEEDDHPIM